MTISEAGEISNLIKYLPLEQAAYTETANVDDLNGWCVVFKNLDIRVYDYNVAHSFLHSAGIFKQIKKHLTRTMVRRWVIDLHGQFTL